MDLPQFRRPVTNLFNLHVASLRGIFPTLPFSRKKDIPNIYLPLEFGMTILYNMVIPNSMAMKSFYGLRPG
jgi:hypothetical protein